jgi:radical SAM protein with 4Fe4S-binding SPASM domain
MSCATGLFGSEFSREEIARTKAAQGLLSMELEVGTLCNFACRYCYVGDDHACLPGERDELTLPEMRDAVEQAQALGARKIILLGGEPMLYEFTLAFCEWMRGRGLTVELFTNGSNMTPGAAATLFGLGVHVVLKWHSADAAIQDWLAGLPGASAIMETARRNLLAAGYPANTARLGQSTVICRQNLAELPGQWRRLRAAGIEPYYEMITPQGRARDDVNRLSPSMREVRQLFETIQAIDRESFGRVWEAQPPLVGNACLRHAYSCLVSATGDVKPCVGVTLPVGNIRRQPLARILADSEVIADLRNHAQTIQGVCGACEKAAACYGCRGAAYQLTGNYLGSDPLCWRHREADDCAALPIAAERLVPHQPPARLIEALAAVGERSATVTARVPADSPHCRGGRLVESAHLELMAQAAAALHGYRTQMRPGGRRADGMLVGARGLEVLAPIHPGEALTISLRKEARLGAFGVLTTEIHRDGALVSRAELKTWHAE